MSKLDKGGLSQAHERIEGLMDDLDSTLTIVKRLAESGEGQAAMHLLDRQRQELYRVIDSISGDVAARGTWRRSVRRHVATAAAAAVVAVTMLAASVVALNRPDALQQASAQLTQARAIADPAERLTRIITVYRTVTRTIPANQSSEVVADVLDALEEAEKDAASNPDSQDVAKQAQAAVVDIQEGREPTPPSPPSTGEGPLDPLGDIAPSP